MLCFGPTVWHLMLGILRKSTWQQLFQSDCKVQLFGGLKYQVLWKLAVKNELQSLELPLLMSATCFPRSVPIDLVN